MPLSDSSRHSSSVVDTHTSCHLCFSSFVASSTAVTFTKMSSSSNSSVHSAASIGYGGSNATTYHSIRPGYPDEVADYVLQHTLLSSDHPSRDSTQQHVLDVGCGTGKWTVTLDAALKRHNINYQLEAADPVSSMTAELAHSLPHISVHTAPASELPYNDERFDLLTAATSFHWFCDEASVRSLHRVLKPGCCFAVLGYDLTVQADWTQPMQQLFETYYPPDSPLPRYGHWRRALDKAQHHHLLHPLAHRLFQRAAVMRTDRAGFVNRFLSASMIAALSSEEKARAIEKFNAIIDSDDRFVGKTEYVMMDDIEVTIVKRVQ